MPHEKGVALILSKEAGLCLKEREQISKRIIFDRLKSKCQNAKIIQVYAPTNDAQEEINEKFYHQLQITYGQEEGERPDHVHWESS